MTDRAKYWSGMLRDWDSSGLTQAEFCRRRGLEAVNFSWWKRRLRGRGEGKGRGHGKANVGSGTVPLVEVALPEIANRLVRDADSTGYEVALPCGTVIRLPADFDVDRTSQLIAAMSRSC